MIATERTATERTATDATVTNMTAKIVTERTAMATKPHHMVMLTTATTPATSSPLTRPKSTTPAA